MKDLKDNRPQFAPSKHSASPETYLAAARRLRRIAAKLELQAFAQTPEERMGRTKTVNGLAQYAKHLSRNSQGD